MADIIVTTGGVNIEVTVNNLSINVSTEEKQILVQPANVFSSGVDVSDGTTSVLKATSIIFDGAGVTDNGDGSVTVLIGTENIQDVVGAMVSGNTETLISVTYDDGAGKLNFAVEDDLSQYDNSTSGFLSSIPASYLESGDNVSELVNDAGYLTSYTETDTFQSVTDRGATTTNAITIAGGSLVSGGSLLIDTPNAGIKTSSNGLVFENSTNRFLRVLNFTTWADNKDTSYFQAGLPHMIFSGNNGVKLDRLAFLSKGTVFTSEGGSGALVNPQSVLQAIGTGEQYRNSYDSTNYNSFKTNSSGGLNVSVNTTDMLYLRSGGLGIGVAPVASAKLQADSTTQGFLPPRMTTTQRDAISSPAEGLVIYNTTTSKLNVYTTSWEAITSV